MATSTVHGLAGPKAVGNSIRKGGQYVGGSDLSQVGLTLLFDQRRLKGPPGLFRARWYYLLCRKGIRLIFLSCLQG